MFGVRVSMLFRFGSLFGFLVMAESSGGIKINHDLLRLDINEWRNLEQYW